MFAAISKWVAGNTVARDEAFAVVNADQFDRRPVDQLAVLTNLYRTAQLPHVRELFWADR